MPEGHADLQSVMFAPMTIDNKALGIFGFAGKPGGFDDNDARIATVFAEITAIALRNNRTAANLKNSEERFRSLIQTVGNIIVLISPDMKVLEFNQEAESFFGLKRKKVLGKHLFDLLSLDEPTRQKISAKTKEIILSETTNAFEFPITKHDGARVCIFVECRKVIGRHK